MGYDSIDTVMQRGAQPLSPAAFEEAVNAENALVLDVRSPQEFAAGFIPNSVFIGLDGQFAPWVGALILDIRQPIVLVTHPGREEETVVRLARVGYDNCIGYLDGGFDAWKNAGFETDTITSISVDAFAAVFEKNPEVHILDSRRPGEYATEHLAVADSFPLDEINENMGELDKSSTYFIHCAGGYRSMITASILRARGFENLVDIQGGIAALKSSGKFDLY